MNAKEALTRVKTGNFNGDHGFDMQLLVDTVGIIGEMLKSGQISEVVHCRDCIHWSEEYDHNCMIRQGWFSVSPDYFCASGERKEGR